MAPKSAFALISPDPDYCVTKALCVPAPGHQIHYGVFAASSRLPARKQEDYDDEKITTSSPKKMHRRF